MGSVPSHQPLTAVGCFRPEPVSQARKSTARKLPLQFVESRSSPLSRAGNEIMTILRDRDSTAGFARACVDTAIAGQDCQTMLLQGSCRDDQVGLRKRMAAFAAVFDEKRHLKMTAAETSITR